MSQAEQSFPRSELATAQHQQIRDLLVREAGPAARHKPTRLRVAVPAAALAVCVSVAGATLVTTNWDRLAQGPAAQIENGTDCRFAHPAALTQGTDVLYVGPPPLGWSSEAHLNQERYCRTGTEAMAAFIKTGSAGRISAAVTLWRSLPPNPEDPEGRVIKDPDQVPVGTTSGSDRDESAATADPAPAPVTVRSRPGWRIGQDALTWTEPDGRRWSITAIGLTATQMTAIAEELTLEGTRSSWPEAAASGYQQLVIPPRPEPKELDWQPKWTVCYRRTPAGGCSLSVTARRSGQQWQAWLSTWSTNFRLVDVGGRPGVVQDVTPGQEMLETQAADGTLLTVAGEVPPGQTLAAFAAQLRRVAPDDPGIHLAKIRD
jgi:hypothetical protein